MIESWNNKYNSWTWNYFIWINQESTKQCSLLLCFCFGRQDWTFCSKTSQNLQQIFKWIVQSFFYWKIRQVWLEQSLPKKRRNLGELLSFLTSLVLLVYQRLNLASNIWALTQSKSKTQTTRSVHCKFNCNRNSIWC